MANFVVKTLVLTGLVASAISANAIPIYDNLAATSNGSDPIGSFGPLYDSFTSASPSKRSPASRSRCLVHQSYPECPSCPERLSHPKWLLRAAPSRWGCTATPARHRSIDRHVGNHQRLNNRCGNQRLHHHASHRPGAGGQHALLDSVSRTLATPLDGLIRLMCLERVCLGSILQMKVAFSQQLRRALPDDGHGWLGCSRRWHHCLPLGTWRCWASCPAAQTGLTSGFDRILLQMKPASYKAAPSF